MKLKTSEVIDYCFLENSEGSEYRCHIKVPSYITYVTCFLAEFSHSMPSVALQYMKSKRGSIIFHFSMKQLVYLDPTY